MKMLVVLIALILSCSVVSVDDWYNSDAEAFQDKAVLNSDDLPGYGGVIKSQMLLGEYMVNEKWILPVSDSIMVSPGRGCWINAACYLVDVVHTDSSTEITDTAQYLREYYWISKGD